MKKIKTKEELQIEVNQLESKIFELERSKLQSSTCLENSPVCTKIVDLDFNLQYMSNAGVRALHIDDISTFYGKPFPFSFFPDAYKIRMNENLLRAKETGETIIHEGEILDVKGNKLWFQATITPVYNKQGKIDHILVVSIDTSTRQQAEEELKTSIEREKEWADMVRKAPLPMAFGYPDGRLANCNSAFSVLTGYTITELQSINWNEVLTPSKWNTIEEEQLSKLSPLHKSVKYEKEYIHKDGHPVPIELTVSAKFNSAGNLLHYIGFAIDITDRILAEKELKESEARFKSLIQQSPFVIELYDLNGLQISVNKAYEELWDFPAETTVNKFNVLESKEVEESGLMTYVKRAYAGESVVVPEFIFDPKGDTEAKGVGRVRWLSTRIYPLKEISGKIKNIVIVHQDITDRKHAEEALLESEATILNKLKAITQPEGDIGSLELADIVDVEALRSIMDDFYKITGMLAAVLDLKGNVLVAVGWQDICTKFHRCNPDTLKNCIESDTILTQGVQEGTCKAYQCKNNMWDIVTPLMLGGKHLGNLFMGQYFLEGKVPDVELFREQARKYGFDEEEYLAALDRVPHFSQEMVDLGMKFYSKLAGIISTLSYSTIQQSRLITDRELVAKELMESEERFRSIVEQSPLSTQIFLPNGTAIVVNRAFINLWGITLEDLKDYNILEDQQLVSLGIMPYIKRAFSGEVTSIPAVEYNSAKSFENGKKSWVQARIYPVKDNAGNIDKIILIHEDITEIKKAEQGFRESEERFRNAITYSPYPLMIHADGEVLQLSEEWIKQTGYTIDDIPTIKQWSLKAYGKDAVPSQEFIDNLYKIDKPQNDGEWEVRIKDGTYRLWDFRTSPIGKLPNGKSMVISMASDITERKLAEEKIRAAEQNLQNTFDLSPSIIAKANLETGYFIEANQAVTRILGYSVEEFTSTPYMEFIHPDYRDQSVSVITHQLGGKEVSFFENQYICKDGSHKWMAWHATKADENGIANAIGSSINERKDTEIQLKIALEKALESDRLKSAFLANMSHEIRTPMNGIRGFIGLLKEPNLSRSEINTYSNIIDKSSDRLLNTINDIIDIAKIEAGEMLVSKNETAINSMMDELYSFYAPEAKLKGLSLLLKPFTQQLKITTDSHKLYGIMSNLIKNAIKYTNKGSITFGYVLRTNTESVLNKQDRNVNVEFFVEDTGTGVPKERMQAIFNRFEQADIEDKKALEGSGLGLAISKAYIDMLGGEIFVESEPGKGSKFTFTIPHNEIKKESKMKTSNTIDNKTSKLENLKVLVVEDDEVSSIFFKTMLEGVFQNVIFAKNGMEAIQLCKNGSEIDLVLMDIKMPVMDGYKATREIRKFNKDLVIIAQTAYALHGDKEKAIEAGCNGYITKPIIKAQLLELISKHIAR